MTSQDTIENLTLFVNRGITPKYTESSQSSITVLNQKCIRDFQVSLEPARLHDCSKRKVTEGKELQKYDILINSTGVGTLGRVAQFFGETGSATVDSHITIVRPNIEKIDPVFLGYAVKAVQEIIEGFAAGSTGQTELSRDAVKALKLEFIEDRVSQEKVANFLLAIDDKIELNRQTNQTLEAIAQALFKSWFVDFDPVKAKMAVLESGGSAEEAELAAMGVISSKSADELAEMKAKSPADFEQLAETAGLFPSALVGSELGVIPEGWGCDSIKDIAVKISKGTTPRKSDLQTAQDFPSTVFLKVKDISDFGDINRSGLEKIPVSIHCGVLKRSILQRGDILFSIAGTIGRVSIIESDLDNSNCNQAIAFIRLREPDKYLELCRLNLRSLRVQDEVISKVVQGVQANFSLSELGNIRIVDPCEEVLIAFNRQVLSLGEKARGLLSENRNLAEVRDTLLPKLLSGEIQLKDSEAES